MNIGIIGAGHIGGTLTRRLSALGHNVFVANSRPPETLVALAHETCRGRASSPLPPPRTTRRGVGAEQPAQAETRGRADRNGRGPHRRR